MVSIPPDRARHIRQSWEILEATAPQASSLFYDHLFTANPDLIPMFKDNMSEQGDKLMQMLRFAVQELDNPEQFVTTFQDLGRRHARYGVRKGHYALVGAALLSAIAELLGERFTPEVREAWGSFYDAMAGIMIAGGDH